MTQRLITLKKKLEAMSICHQVEVLRILNDNTNLMISENKNGSFINLTEVSDIDLAKLDKYISYVNTQQEQLNTIESEKHRLEDIYFNSIKDRNANT